MGIRALVPPAYPFLLSAWPALALATRNPRAVSGPGDLVLPIAVAAGVTAIGWILGRVLSPDRHLRGVLAALAVGWWWSYQLLVTGLRQVPGLGSALAGWMTVLLLVVLAWALSRRLPSWPARVTTMGNIGASLLVLISVVQFSMIRPREGLPADLADTLDLPAFPKRATPLPDVFILVLDAYSGTESLLEFHGYDNRPFEEEMRRRGFIVPERFRANYTGTANALTALLNWDDVQTFAPELDATSWDRGQLLPFAEESRTWRFFDRAGYQIVYASGGMTGVNRYAVAQFEAEVSSFREAWTAMTPLRDLAVWRRNQVREPASRDDPGRQALHHEQRLAFVARESGRPGPLLVFAHFLVPHDPYVFHADCRHRLPPLAPWYDRDLPSTLLEPAYIEQLQCTNRQVLALIDEILVSRDPAPVVLLVSDHGFGGFHTGVMPLAEATARQLRERLDILGAIRVPAEHRAEFSGVETPVGAIRMMMRTVFGAELDDLEEVSYWSSQRRPFAFERIPPPSGAGS